MCVGQQIEPEAERCVCGAKGGRHPTQAEGNFEPFRQLSLENKNQKNAAITASIEAVKDSKKYDGKAYLGFRKIQ